MQQEQGVRRPGSSMCSASGGRSTGRDAGRQAVGETKRGSGDGRLNEHRSREGRGTIIIIMENRENVHSQHSWARGPLKFQKGPKGQRTGAANRAAQRWALPHSPCWSGGGAHMGGHMGR